MTPIAELVNRLIAAGCDPTEAAVVVAEAHALGARPPDSTAERRREWDREYRRKKRESTRHPPDPPDIGRTPSLSKEVSKKERERATRIPPDMELPTDWRALAASKGLTEPETVAQFEHFKNHFAAKPGQRGLSLNWKLNWSTWCGRFLEYAGRTRATAAGMTPEEYHRTYTQGDNSNGQAAETAASDGGGTAGSDHEEDLLGSWGTLHQNRTSKG